MYFGINRPYSVSRRRQAEMWSAYRRRLSGAASTVLLILLSRSSISACWQRPHQLRVHGDIDSRLLLVLLWQP